MGEIAHLWQGGPGHAPVRPRAVPSPGRVPPPAVPPGWRVAVRRRPVRRLGGPRPDGRRRSPVRPDLLPARDSVGVPRPDAQPGPVVPGRRRPAERRPGVPRPAAVLGPDRGLLPGPPAAARAARRGPRPPGRAGAGRRIGPEVALETAAGVR